MLRLSTNYNIDYSNLVGFPTILLYEDIGDDKNYNNNNALYNLLESITNYEYYDEMVDGIKLIILNIPSMTNLSKVYIDKSSIPLLFSDLTIDEIYDYISVNIQKNKKEIIDNILNQVKNLQITPIETDKYPSFAYFSEIDNVILTPGGGFLKEYLKKLPDQNTYLGAFEILGKIIYIKSQMNYSWEDINDDTQFKVYTCFQDPNQEISNLFSLKLWILQNLQMPLEK